MFSLVYKISNFVRLFNIIISMIILSPILNSSAELISNRFFVYNKHLDFEKKITDGKCFGRIDYPRLSHDDEEIFIRINEEIKDFVQIYGVCNKNERSNFSVFYDMPEPNTKEFFSIRWITKKDDIIWRIDTLNFNYETGALLKSERIFNLLANNMMSKMIELSQGYLHNEAGWENFLEKIESRDIQLYLKDRKWYVVFNPIHELDKIVEVEIPEYFLVGNEDYDRG